MPNHGEKETRPMNFIFLFSDQHSPHMLGCYGNEAVRTPHLDALAARGARFANACCNCPVCVPSRAAMAMGDYASRGGYWDNAFAYDGAEPSWAGRLEEEGYRVTAIGKMHFKDDSPATGFLDQRIPLHIKDGKGDIYGTIRDKTITRPQFRQAILDAREGESDYSRFDREVARRAADFLTREAAGEGRPFALYVGFVTPHFPLIAPPEYAALYPDAGSVRTPVAFDRAHWADHPVLNDYRRYCCQEGLTDAQRLHAVRIYYALCSFLDAQVGTVLDAVTQAGLWENTCVVYTSDHGDMMGEHGLFFKSTMYEGSVGVPMLLAAPGVAPGTVCKTPVSLVDIYPTALECLGVAQNAREAALPGASLLPLARGREEPGRAVYAEYLAFGCYSGAFMIRDEAYKYVYYPGERPQLFDLKNDPDECADLAQDPAMAEVLAHYHEKLLAVCDPDETERRAEAAQKACLDSYGGRDEFLRTFKPMLFSPIPDLEEKGG